MYFIILHYCYPGKCYAIPAIVAFTLWTTNVIPTLIPIIIISDWISDHSSTRFDYSTFSVGSNISVTVIWVASGTSSFGSSTVSLVLLIACVPLRKVTLIISWCDSVLIVGGLSSISEWWSCVYWFLSRGPSLQFLHFNQDQRPILFLHGRLKGKSKLMRIGCRLHPSWGWSYPPIAAIFLDRSSPTLSRCRMTICLTPAWWACWRWRFLSWSCGRSSCWPSPCLWRI